MQIESQDPKLLRSGGVCVCVSTSLPISGVGVGQRVVDKMLELGVPDYFPSCPHKHPPGQLAPWSSPQRLAQRVGRGPKPGRDEV